MPGTATICGACSADLGRALQSVRWLAAELETTLSRQTSKTGGGRSAETPLPFDPRASEAAYVLRSTLVAWTRVLAEQTGDPWPEDSCESMAAWLSERLSWLVRHPAATEAHGEILAAVRDAQRVVDRPPGYLYAGPCDGCGYALYAKPGASAAHCRTPDCEAGPADVADRREWMREECKDLLGSPSYVAMVCTGLGAPVSPSTVRVWISRKKILPRHFVRPIKDHGEPRPLYRVGDVLRRVVGDDEEEAYSA